MGALYKLRICVSKRSSALASCENVDMHLQFLFQKQIHKCNMHTIFIKHYLWMPCHHNYCYSSRLSAVFILPPQYSSTNFSFLKFSHFCCQVALFQSYKIYNISCIIVFKHRFSEKALYVLFVGFFCKICI